MAGLCIEGQQSGPPTIKMNDILHYLLALLSFDYIGREVMGIKHITPYIHVPTYPQAPAVQKKFVMHITAPSSV